MKRSALLLALFALSLGLRAQLVIGAFVRVQHGSHGINKKIK